MKVLVTGGRDYADLNKVYESLDAIHHKHRIEQIIHGGARGADSLAFGWAVARCVPDARFDANWAEDGRKAGPMRNQRMLDEGKPDVVVAFPGGRGTADMIRRAKDSGVPVICPPFP